MDLGAAFLQGLPADVEQKIAQTNRPPEMRTGGDPLDESAAFVDAWFIRGCFHLCIYRRVHDPDIPKAKV